MKKAKRTIFSALVLILLSTQNVLSDTILSIESAKQAILNNQIDEGIKLYTEALSSDSNNIEALYFRGLAYRHKGETAQALEDLIKVTNLVPELATPYPHIAQIYMSTANYKEALPYLDKAIEQSPDNDDLYGYRVVCYLELKEYQKANKDLTKMYEINPNNEVARRFMEINARKAQEI